jgi:hypothetical protein
MSKNSDRAHLEKNLEDLMDNDWRVFRARLVAQEAAESKEDSKNPSLKTTPTNHDDEKLAKQGQLGEVLVRAISNIFSKDTHDEEETTPATTQTFSTVVPLEELIYSMTLFRKTPLSRLTRFQHC